MPNQFLQKYICSTSPITMHQKSSYKYILFAVGLSAIAIQSLFARQVAPFVGTSIPVFNVIVSVFLAALAIGIKRGGTRQDDHSKALSRNLILSSLLLTVGASYMAVALFFEGYYWFVDYAELRSTLFSNTLLALFVYLMIAMFPLVYLVEQSVPLLMYRIEEEMPAPEQAGNAFNASTWGNVLGGVFTTLLCMPILGVGWSITLNAMAFAVISVRVVDYSMSRRIVYPLGILLLNLFINYGFENFMFLKTNAYTNFSVVENEKEDARHFVLNNSNSSMIYADGRQLPYQEDLQKAVFDDLKIIGKDILILGAGGFTFSMDGEHGNRVTYVDIDPNIKSIAESHFLEAAINGKFVNEDARVFLNKNHRKWDVIVLDVFSNVAAIPANLITKEFFFEVRSNLNDGGHAFFNIIARPTMTDRYSKGVDNTIRSVFPNCVAHYTDYWDKRANLLYSCSPSAMERYSTVYTDDKTVVDFDAFKLSISDSSI